MIATAHKVDMIEEICGEHNVNPSEKDIMEIFERYRLTTKDYHHTRNDEHDKFIPKNCSIVTPEKSLDSRKRE
jgi:hypothetical protein